MQREMKSRTPHAVTLRRLKLGVRTSRSDDNQPTGHVLILFVDDVARCRHAGTLARRRLLAAATALYTIHQSPQQQPPAAAAAAAAAIDADSSREARA